MATPKPTIEELIESTRGREPYIARKSYPPFTIAVYDDPAWAEELGAELGAAVHHAPIRQPNVAATFSVIAVDDPSVPGDPTPLADFLNRASG